MSLSYLWPAFAFKIKPLTSSNPVSVLLVQLLSSFCHLTEQIGRKNGGQNLDKNRTSSFFHLPSSHPSPGQKLDNLWTLVSSVQAIGSSQARGGGEPSDGYFVTMNHGEGVDERWRGWARLALSTKSAAKAAMSMLTNPAWEWPFNHYLFWNRYWIYKLCTYEYMFLRVSPS